MSFSKDRMPIWNNHVLWILFYNVCITLIYFQKRANISFAASKLGSRSDRNVRIWSKIELWRSCILSIATWMFAQNVRIYTQTTQLRLHSWKNDFIGKSKRDYWGVWYVTAQRYYENLFFTEACEKTFCRWGAECVSLGDGRAHCACPASCPNTAAAVCSTIGRTYRNHCFLRKEACERRLNLRVRHEGECGELLVRVHKILTSR